MITKENRKDWDNVCFMCKKHILADKEKEIIYEITGLDYCNNRVMQQLNIYFHEECWKDTAGEEFMFEELK